MPEQQAFTYGAEGKKETAPQAYMQDKCFLCSQTIGEADPRQFYTGPQGSSGVMMLAHTGCLNKFMANDEKWPVAEEEPKPKVADLGDARRVTFGFARLIFSPYHLVVSCDDLIAEHGLKTVIPDLIVALRAAEESL